MSNLGTLKINVYENHDGEMVFTSKEINNKNNNINKSERIKELEKFWDNYDNMSDKDKIDKLKHLLLWYQTDYVDLGIKNMQLKDEIKNLKDKLDNIELENNKRDMKLIDAVIDTIYETDRKVYDRIVRNVKFGEELI